MEKHEESLTPEPVKKYKTKRKCKLCCGKGIIMWTSDYAIPPRPTRCFCVKEIKEV